MPKLLLVEDNEMNRDMLSRRLTKRGFEVDIAVDGIAGAEAGLTGVHDLILLDMSLPGLTGWEVAKRLKAEPAVAGIPIIALTADVLAEKSRRALGSYLALNPANPHFCVAGGVAANMAIRSVLGTVSTDQGCVFVAPPLSLCTDNAAMITYAALEQMEVRGPDDMSLSARPRWPLDTSQPSMLGSGKKGAKA